VRAVLSLTVFFSRTEQPRAGHLSVASAEYDVLDRCFVAGRRVELGVRHVFVRLLGNESMIACNVLFVRASRAVKTMPHVGVHA